MVPPGLAIPRHLENRYFRCCRVPLASPTARDYLQPQGSQTALPAQAPQERLGRP